MLLAAGCPAHDDADEAKQRFYLASRLLIRAT